MSYPPPPPPPPPPDRPDRNVPGYPPPPPPPYRPVPSTNGMAIASLVLGILWVYWIGSILALIFGYVAKRQIAETGQSGRGMAIAGIVLGWVGVGTLVIFIVIIIIAAASGEFDEESFEMITSLPRRSG